MKIVNCRKDTQLAYVVSRELVLWDWQVGPYPGLSSSFTGSISSAEFVVWVSSTAGSLIYEAWLVVLSCGCLWSGPMWCFGWFLWGSSFLSYWFIFSNFFCYFEISMDHNVNHKSLWPAAARSCDPRPDIFNPIHQMLFLSNSCSIKTRSLS